jgi:WS/DGAT/MGAT family acyltransferase
MRQAAEEQLVHPLRAAGEAVATVLAAPRQVAEAAASSLSALGGLVAQWRAPLGPFNAPVGANRRFAMRELRLADVRAIRGVQSCTVNDVVLTLVAGALSRYLAARGERTQGRTLRAMVPVSTRDLSGRMTLGNQVSAFFVDLPVAALDESVRLRRIAAITQNLKRSHQAVGAAALVNLGTWAPPTIHSLAARVMADQRFANLIISNVPGPQKPLYLAGARQLVTYPVMPLAGNLGLSVAVTSLDGMMGIGLTGDWDSLRDIELLADSLDGAVAALMSASDLGRTRARTRIKQPV